MSRTCKKCSIELVEDTRFNSDVKAGINICKSCRTNRMKKHYSDNKEIYRKNVERRYKKAIHDNVVYLLEDENYVGVTQNIEWRMSQHRSKGKSTNNYRILHSTPNREDALELEELLHDMGYEGKHTNNRYK